MIERLTRLDRSPKKNLVFEEVRGVRCAIIGNEFRSKRIIFFVHGGGFALCGIGSHYRFLRFLSETTSSCIVFPEYTKTPDAIYPQQLHECLAVLDSIQRKTPASELVLMGDSAGGNLAASMLNEMKKDYPDKLILLSPWLDLTGKIIDESGLEGDDVFGRAEVARYAELYYGENNPADASISPLFAVLPKFIPTLVLSTRNELFHPIIAEYVEQNRSDNLHHLERDGLFHVWPLFVGMMPEATRDAKLICDFIVKGSVE
ncbi:MAG: alpha/beta hydrolase fold domain-containing protein [Flavobacteriales bacterium]